MPNPMQYPSDWTQKKFEDFATLQRGKDLPVQSREEGIFPILGSNGVCGYHNDFVSEGPGVVTGRSGSVGGSYYVDGKFWPLNTALWVKDFHGNFPLFVHYFFQSFDFARFKGGVSVPTLNRNLFSHELVTIPPLPEQRTIAHLLAKIQEAIAAQQEIIDRTNEVKKATMVKLFSELSSLTSKKRIEDFADVKGGKRLPKGEAFAEGETLFPYIRVVDMKDNSVLTNNLKYITPEIQKTIARYTINVQNLYITIAGTIGVVGKIPDCLDGANLTENAAKIVFHKNSQVNRDYLMWFLNSEIAQTEIASRTVKTSQPKLALARICTIEVPVPSEKIQVEISEALNLLVEKRRASEFKKELLQDLFKTMLHELMTGNIRTTPLMEV